MTHFLRIIAATAGIMLATVLPFLPGRYESLAVALSTMARILTPQEPALDQSRGHYAVHAAPYPHWKYFWFD